jgi:predicted amidohydrolase
LGASFIAGPQGEILAQASHDKEEILIAEVDLDLQKMYVRTGRSLETEELMLLEHY